MHEMNLFLRTISQSRRRGKRAISEIIAALLLILITVSLGVTVLFFSTTQLDTLSTNFVNLMSDQGQAISDNMAVEQVQFETSLYGSSQYVPISISNTIASTTPAPFQQLVTIDPALYTSSEATDLGNIRFYSTLAGNTFYNPLNSWLESVSSTPANGATSANFWINLPSGIGASSSTTIYMVFQSTGTEFDGIVAGEAPQLSATYGEYDNGASVFLAYFNGNTPTSDFSTYSGYSIASAAGVSYTTGVVNALHVTGYSSANPDLVFNVPLSNSPMIAEANVESPGSVTPGTDTGETGFVNNAVANSVNNAISVNMGYGASYLNLDYINGGTSTVDQSAQGTATTSWTYSSTSYLGPTSTSYSGYNAPQLYSIAGGYTATATVNPLSGATNVYFGVVSDTTATYTVNEYYNWGRVRAYPPSGVMPTATPGTLQTTSGNVANIFLRNDGTTQIEISAVYLISTTNNTVITKVGYSPALTVNQGSFVELSINYGYVIDTPYTFTVVAQDSSKVSYTALA